MAFSVQMPALGESVTEGNSDQVAEGGGDTVEADEPLLEVSTDKVDTEILAPASGVLIKIVAQEDDVVEIGGELALIGDASESAAPHPRPHRQPKSPPQPHLRQNRSRLPQPAPASAAEGTEVVMPALGESVTEGTVTNWLKAVGDEGVGRRAAAGGLHRQGRHRDPRTSLRHPAGDLAQEDDVVEVGGKPRDHR